MSRLPKGSLLRRNYRLRETGCSTTLDCPKCGGEVFVKNTLPYLDFRFRRKICRECNYHFLTVELWIEDVERMMKGSE